LGFGYLFRLGGDHFFCHRQFEEAGRQLQHLFFEHVIEMSRLMRHLAKRRAVADVDEANRKRFLALFNGFKGILPIDPGKSRDGWKS